MAKPTVSTTSLAASIRQSFSGVETFLGSHQRLDQTARMLKLRLLTVKTHFLSEIKFLLPGSSARGVATKNTQNERSLEGSIRIKLGPLYGRLRDSMRRVQGALESITEILEERARDTKWESRIKLILSSCWWGLVAILRVLRIGYPKVPVQTNVVTEKPGFERLGLGKGPGGSPDRLEELLAGLEKDIRTISGIRQLVHEPSESESDPLQTSTVSSLSSSGESTNSEQLGSERNCIINDLYNLLSRELCCRCHLTHLSLCSVSADPSSTNPMDSICSFFVTLDLNTSMNTDAARNPLCLTASRPPVPTPTPPHTERPTGCSRIITSAIPSKHSLVCQSLTRIEFLIKSTLPTPNPSTHPNSPPILTLRELLGSHSRGETSMKLGDRDRFLLAAKLAQWVLRCNGTHWLYDLDACKIRFFTRYESDLNCGNWTPYLSTSLNGPSPAHKQRGGGLYALGLVLLELGLQVPFTDESQREAGAIKIALRELLTKYGLGYRYQCIVKELLGGRSKEEKLINDLEHWIKSKEKVLEFLSE
ncbi:hypothetical protein HOY80DRAFT_129246 [Tuber brumale]|nr:hypothetical protein HOY80DRAFT_129246 [Tuber brumale]